MTARPDAPSTVDAVIVGAGFGGISAAGYLAQAGYDVTVYEKEAEVGGVWSASRRYPGLTTQNPRTTYALSAGSWVRAT